MKRSLSTFDSIGFAAALICVSLLELGAPGCVQAPVNEHRVASLIPSTLRVRRPEGAGADPSVGPGGGDYTSQPLPDERLDCTPIETLYKELDLEQVRQCLISIHEPYEANYRLRRYAVPYAELMEPEKAPSCLREKLAKLPVPREIIYQSIHERPSAMTDDIFCYSTRLNLEADELLSVKLALIDKVAVRVEFPLKHVPRDRKDLTEMMMTWSLAPLWDLDDHRFPAKVVPDAICRRCIGEKNMFKKVDPEAPPVFWPVH